VQGDAAFRTAKNDLGLRPIFHQKDNRVQAHILVCFLALALWPTLEHWMHAKGMGTCARHLIKQVAGIKSMDVLPPIKRGDLVNDLRLRIVGTPEPATAQLLAHLGLRLPRDSREIGNVVPKIGGEMHKSLKVSHSVLPTAELGPIWSGTSGQGAPPPEPKRNS